MGTDSGDGAAPREAACVRCGIPTKSYVGGIPVCEECYQIRGSCCPEFGPDDLTDNCCATLAPDAS